MARGQFVDGDETSGVVFRSSGTGDLCDWSFSGDAEASAGTFDATKTLVWVHGVLPAATGRAEFIFDEPVVERI
jgi:hypothetical protein